MLLGGLSGERLEPVGVMARAVLDRPVLHAGGDDVGDGRIERLAVVDGPEQAPVDLLGKPLPHDGPGEDVAAEDRVDPFDRGGSPVGRAYRCGAYDVLAFLATRAGRLVPKQELMDAVWGDVAVTDDSLVQCLMEIRRALGYGPG